MVEILKDNAPPEAGATVPSTCPGRNSSGRLTVSKWWSWEQSPRRDKPGYDPTHLPIAVPKAFMALAEGLLRQLRQARLGSCPITRVRPPPDSHAGGRSTRCQGSEECWARDGAARQAPPALESHRAVLRPLKESRTGEA